MNIGTKSSFTCLAIMWPCNIEYSKNEHIYKSLDVFILSIAYI
jgi:hypothetical protein